MAVTPSGWQYALPTETLLAWPAVSQAVADKLEDVLGTVDVNTPWTTFTPVLVGWSVGTTGSSATGRYYQINKTVIAQINFTFGTVGATFPSGSPSVALPILHVSTNPSNTSAVQYNDVSATTAFIGTTTFTTSRVSFNVNNTAGTYATATALSPLIPMTWAAGDSISLQIIYEVA